MSLYRRSSVLLIVLAALCVARWLPAAEPSVLALLGPYKEFVAQCVRYSADLVRVGGAMQEEFDNATNVVWGAGVSPGTPTVPKLIRVDGRSVLAISAPTNRAVYIPIGSPMVGDSEVEMVAYSDADVPCDLSLYLGLPGQAPGFQFGAWNNTRNRLWTDAGDNTFRAVELPANPRVIPRHWHTVGIKLDGRELVASVDGKELGRTKLSDRYDVNRVYQPLIYCHGTTIYVDRFTIRRKSDMAQIWRAAFGEVDSAKVYGRMDQLIALLDHDDSRVRDGAQDLLSQIRTMAAPALRKIAATGTFEQQLRAREILWGTPGSGR